MRMFMISVLFYFAIPFSLDSYMIFYPDVAKDYPEWARFIKDFLPTLIIFLGVFFLFTTKVEYVTNTSYEDNEEVLTKKKFKKLKRRIEDIIESNIDANVEDRIENLENEMDELIDRLERVIEYIGEQKQDKNQDKSTL